jgi:hypothetical protein
MSPQFSPTAEAAAHQTITPSPPRHHQITPHRTIEMTRHTLNHSGVVFTITSQLPVQDCLPQLPSLSHPVTPISAQVTAWKFPDPQPLYWAHNLPNIWN